MTIIPIKDLKDSAKVSALCHSANEPVHVTKNGYADLVIMSAEVYDHLENAARSGETLYHIQAGINAIENGKYRDAREALSEVRAKYGI